MGPRSTQLGENNEKISNFCIDTGDRNRRDGCLRAVKTRTAETAGKPDTGCNFQPCIEPKSRRLAGRLTKDGRQS